MPKTKPNRETELLQLQLTRELYKKSFYEFFKDAVCILEPATEWSFNWHHEYLAEILELEGRRVAANEPKTKDYAISIPPRTGKSLLISVCFNAWQWGCVSPHTSFIIVSHTEALSVDLAFKTKKLIESNWYRELFPHVELRADRSSIQDFENTASGKRQSFSMGAGVTGFGSAIVIVDDPIKPQEISPLQLENAIKIYRETIYNRVNNPRTAVRFVISQRLAPRDIIGYILENNDNDRFQNICLPATLTENVFPVELAEKYLNGYLWEDRFPGEVLADIRNGLGSHGYSSQYLQNPVDISNALIRSEWFDIIESAPDIRYDLFIDSAYTDKRSNDATAIMIAGIKDNSLIVKKVYEVWMEFPELIRKIKEIAPPNCKVYIEPKASGKVIVQQLRTETMLNVVELPAPKDSKQTRVTAITPKLESRRVKLVRDTWNESFLYQVVTFPNSKNDDMLDTLVYAMNTLLAGTGKIRWYM